MADIENIPVEDEITETEDNETSEETVEGELSLIDQFKADVKAMTTEYLGYEVSALVLQLAIEQFETIRNYPKSYTEEMKIADMRKNISKIAMAVVEIDSKDGAEGQTGMSENGISRTWTDSIMAYKNVVGFANVL